MVKKASRKKSTSGKKRSGRKYGSKASEKVERSMHEMKRGKLRSGRSGKKVKAGNRQSRSACPRREKLEARYPPPQSANAAVPGAGRSA